MVKWAMTNCESTAFNLQDHLLLNGMKTRTGELMLESGNNIGSVTFHKGKILHAFSPYSRAIGDQLVEGGMITEADLLETLKLQKKNFISPIGGLFIKSGKVSFEVIEMMVHEQIRQSIREFMNWGSLRASFVEKDICPFDRIHLPVYEFIEQSILTSAQLFCSQAPAAF